VLKNGAPDCPDSVRCTKAVHSEAVILGNSTALSTIIHRTVRCATRLSGESAGNGYPAPTVDSAKCYSELHESRLEGGG
jgi:hypothetical protein